MWLGRDGSKLVSKGRFLIQTTVNAPYNEEQEATWGAVNTKGIYLKAQYHRLAARRGAKRALLGVAHTILVTIYHLLRRGTTYQDLGGNYFGERDHQGALRRSVHRLERLGYKVTLEAA
jgi:transposase